MGLKTVKSIRIRTQTTPTTLPGCQLRSKARDDFVLRGDDLVLRGERPLVLLASSLGPELDVVTVASSWA